MKIGLFILVLLACLSSQMQAQTCNAEWCISDVTDEVYGNFDMNCSGAWEPDIEVCWGKTPELVGYQCVVMIWNNSTTQNLILNIEFDGTDYTNETIGSSSCGIYYFEPGDDTVYLDFSSSAHSNTCSSSFEMNCL